MNLTMYSSYVLIMPTISWRSLVGKTSHKASRSTITEANPQRDKKNRK